MRLYLVRHGAAEDPSGGPDSARALTPGGREDVAKVAGVLRASLDAPVEVLASPYLRAQQTAEVLRERLEIVPKIRATECMLPESDWNALRAELSGAAARGAATVIAVGHNPSISAMVGDACGGARVAMAKGAVACIDLDDPAAGGELRFLVTPKSLRGLKGA